MRRSTAPRYEIAVNGQPRSYRHEKTMAIEDAIFLEIKNSERRGHHPRR
jgi:hypothetical protein